MLCSIGYIWWPYAFLSNCLLVDPSWPLHDLWPHRCIALWSGVLSAKFGGHRAFLRNVTSGWPQLTPAWPLTPAISYTLISGSSYQIWWQYNISNKFDHWLTLADPCMTSDPSNALRSGQGFSPPNLVAVGHCWAIWPLLDPGWPLHDLWPQRCISLWSGVPPTKFGGHRALLSKLTLLDPIWPLHDLWPQQCITLWSEILPTKFGGHRAFLSNLTPGWPQMTPTWPLTPAMHYAVVRSSTHQIWQP